MVSALWCKYSHSLQKQFSYKWDGDFLQNLIHQGKVHFGYFKHLGAFSLSVPTAIAISLPQKSKEVP
jgi:hypothetical protein